MLTGGSASFVVYMLAGGGACFLFYLLAGAGDRFLFDMFVYVEVPAFCVIC